MSSEQADVQNRPWYRNKIALVLMAMIVLSVLGCLDVAPYFLGNRALIACLGWYYDQAPDTGACGVTWATHTQQEALSTAQKSALWRSSDYVQLAQSCGARLCECFSNQEPASVYSQDRRIAYYAALAYRLANGRFPVFDECAAYVAIPGRSVLRESQNARRAGKEDLAAAMDEFAYQVDTGWEDDWQRGFHAYEQALRYRESGDNQGAKEAFGRAIESLQLATFRASKTYLSLSFTSLADIFVAEQKWDDAIQAYQQSIFYSPKKEAASFHQLVRIWQQTGNDADYMLRQFDDMRSSFGATDPYLTTEPVLAFLDAGMVEPAHRFLYSAPQEIDDAPVILVTRGRLCERMRDVECAWQYFVRALPEMQETEPLVAAGLAASLAGQSEAAGNVSDATYYGELAVKLNPNATAYRTLLARTYKRNGELDKARHVLQEGLALQPGDSTLKQVLDELTGTTR